MRRCWAGPYGCQLIPPGFQLSEAHRHGPGNLATMVSHHSHRAWLYFSARTPHQTMGPMTTTRMNLSLIWSQCYMFHPALAKDPESSRDSNFPDLALDRLRPLPSGSYKDSVNLPIKGPQDKARCDTCIGLQLVHQAGRWTVTLVL